MKILHLADTHLGSGFSHGKINPATGLNTRLEDFTTALTTCIDRAIAEPVDLVLFGGDAFPDATPPPYVQEAFASQLRRLVDAEIPTVLLVGNHDRHSQGQGGASLSIYRTLGVPGVIVGDTPTTHRISTHSGDIQIFTLPWLNQSNLLTRPETEKLCAQEIYQLLLSKLEPIFEREIRQLDPNLPTILLAHVMAERATLGAERMLAVGKGFHIPLSLLARPCFDYVALGHVHRHQNLNPKNDPPIVYPGSIERVDFGEEKEEKGYVTIEIEPLENESKKFQVDWTFCPLPARRFCSIKVDATQTETPETEILAAIAKAKIDDAVTRLIYQILPHQSERIDPNTFHHALKIAHTYTIRAEVVSQLTQPRLPELGCSSTDPIAALQTYLDSRPDLANLATELMTTAKDLLAEDSLNLVS
jgi:DNA repair protein SbcD/Mre11